MPASTPVEPAGHQSLLTDPAAPTRVLREGDLSSGDPLAARPVPAEEPHAHPDPYAPAPFGPAPAGAEPAPIAPVPFGPQPAGAEPNPFVPSPYGPQPAPYVAPPVEPVADLPAGLDPDELAAAPGLSARRGKLRRRAAFLRAARELLLRDLGGFVYELHRTAHDIEAGAHRQLRETKLARLSRVDAELHDLETRLDDVRRQVLVREPGVGGECPHCGELYGSAAHYCSHCGNPLTDAARRELAKAHQPVEVAPPVAAPDQPTQEISRLEDPNAAFQWPARPATGTDSTTPVGEGDPATSAGAAQGEGVAAEAPREPAAAPVGEGEAATTVHEVPREDAATPVGEGEPATSAEADAAHHDDAPREDAATPVGEAGPATSAEADAARDDEAPRENAATPVGEGELGTTSRADAATPVGEGEPATGADEERSDAVAAEVRGEAVASDAAEEVPQAAGETPAPPDDAPQAAGEAPAAPADAPQAAEETPAPPDDAPQAAEAPREDGPEADATPAERDDTTGGPSADAVDQGRVNGAGDATSEYETWRGQAANGHDESIFSPVERRQ